MQKAILTTYTTIQKTIKFYNTKARSIVVILFWEWRKAREAFGTTDDVTIIYYCMFETAKKNVKGKRMTTKEAIQAMLDGKKVKKSSWGKKEYILLSSDGYVIDNYNSTYSIQNANNWEIYEEPKPKQTVTIEKWLCRNNGYFIAQGDKEYLESIYPLSKVKLLDTYEVEL